MGGLEPLNISLRLSSKTAGKTVPVQAYCSLAEVTSLESTQGRSKRIKAGHCFCGRGLQESRVDALGNAHHVVAVKENPWCAEPRRWIGQEIAEVAASGKGSKAVDLHRVNVMLEREFDGLVNRFKGVVVRTEDKHSVNFDAGVMKGADSLGDILHRFVLVIKLERPRIVDSNPTKTRAQLLRRMRSSSSRSRAAS